MMIAIMRRGGRARLKASDSKSDRGVSPSGVQILSPPPIVLASERLRRAPALDGRADNPRGCAGLRGSTVGQQPPWPGSAARRSGGEPARAVLANTRRGDRAAEGAALEMPCTGNPCAAGSNPAPSAKFAFDVAVLDGEVAVPCSPQSALAGSNPLSRAGRVE